MAMLMAPRLHPDPRQRYLQYLRAIIADPTAINNEMQREEEMQPVRDWAQESRTKEWKDWWRHIVLRLFTLLFWHYLCIAAFIFIGIHWEVLDTAFNNNFLLALVSGIGRVILCILGRKMHTGLHLTRVLIFLDAFLSAFIYNAFVRQLPLQYPNLHFVPLVATWMMTSAYTVVLLIMGIQLTMIRTHGMKMIPLEILIVSLLLGNLPYFGYPKDLEYVKYMAHILFGCLVGFLICTGMACYILDKLRNTLDKTTVRNAMEIYGLPSLNQPLENT